MGGDPSFLKKLPFVTIKHFFKPLILCTVCRELESVPAHVGREVGCMLGRLSVCHRAKNMNTHIHTYSTGECPNHPYCMWEETGTDEPHTGAL